MRFFRVRESLKQTDESSWRKSSFSTYNGNCVEVADGTNDTIRVRDSMNPGPVLAFTAAEWDAFVGAVRGGSNRGNRS